MLPVRLQFSSLSRSLPRSSISRNITARQALRACIPPHLPIFSSQIRCISGIPAPSKTRSLATAAVAVREDVDIPLEVEEPSFAQNEILGPIQEYDRRVAQGRLHNDPHQREIIQHLQNLHEELRSYVPPAVVQPSIESLQPTKSFFGSLFGGDKSKSASLGSLPANLPKGLYLYGDVGSGKTMLMDLFYDTIPPNISAKMRIHFHNFMQNVHKSIHKVVLQHGNDIDAIPFIATDIAQKGTILCFDEFQCTDVADAMILRRLLEALMVQGVVLVTTSNRVPDELYKNGIQRESFIPAINLLKTELHVINLDSPTDYRKIARPPSDVYHYPLDESAEKHAWKWFRFLGDPKHPEPHPEEQTVWGRKIKVPRVSGRCAWFTFDELIGKPTSAADYLELMRSYDSFVITGIPSMTRHQRDLARRFITFIDAAYERQARLVLTSEKPLNELFVLDPGRMKTTLKNSETLANDEEGFAFSRALSRLTQMGSREWVERGLGLERLGGLSEKRSWDKVRGRMAEDMM